jgi:zinc protease
MNRRSFLALTAAGAFAADRKNRAPISRDILRVKLPEANPVTLSNGLTALLLEDNRLPIANVRFHIEGAGALYSSVPGVAAATAGLLLEGAGSRSGRQMAEEAARLGASLSAGAAAGAEVAQLDGTGLTSHLDDWLGLMADALLHPNFPPDEFSVARQRIVTALRMRRSQTALMAEDLAMKMVYGSHPAGELYPAPEEVPALKIEMLQAFYRERYAPANTLVSMVGRIRPSHIRSRLDDLFGAWKAASPKVDLPPSPKPPSERRIRILDRPGSTQSQIFFANLITDRRDPDLVPIAVLNTILGIGAGSRLFSILRGEKRYAFDVLSNYSAPRFPGVWRARAGVRGDATGDAVATIIRILEQLCEQPASQQEMDDAKGSVIGQFALSLEQPQQLINYSYQRQRYGFSPDYWERYPEKIGAVSALEVQNVARKYYNPATAQIAVVGDAAKIRAELSKFGPVQVQSA